MKGRDISVLGKGLKVGLSPALQQMAMCGSDGENGHPGRLQGLRSSWSSARVRSIVVSRCSRCSRAARSVSRASRTDHTANTMDAPRKMAGRTRPHTSRRWAATTASTLRVKEVVLILLLLLATWGQVRRKKESPMIAQGAPQGFLDPLAETRASGRHR